VTVRVAGVVAEFGASWSQDPPAGVVTDVLARNAIAVVESLLCTASDFWLQVELPGWAAREMGLVSTASEAGFTVKVTGMVTAAEPLFGVSWTLPVKTPGL
jgi:hypothetical protein